MKRAVLFVALASACLLAVAGPARADLSDKLGALTADNAKGYLGPLPKAISSTLNAGIFESGYVPRRSFDFSVGVSVMGATFGDGDRTYLPTDPFGFTAVTPTPVPTVVGSPNAVPVPDNGNSTPLYPGGLDVSQFELAAPQVTIGTLYGTRATVRWFDANMGDSDYGKISFLGIGGQHSLSQYMGKKPPVDLALGVFHQSLKIGDGLLDIQSLHVDVTASRKFGGLFRIEPFVSVGWDNFSMKADYKDKTDPSNNYSVDFGSISNKHVAAGAAMTLLFIKLHGEVFAAANSGASLGLTLGH